MAFRRSVNAAPLRATTKVTYWKASDSVFVRKLKKMKCFENGHHGNGGSPRRLRWKRCCCRRTARPGAFGGKLYCLSSVSRVPVHGLLVAMVTIQSNVHKCFVVCNSMTQTANGSLQWPNRKTASFSKRFPKFPSKRETVLKLWSDAFSLCGPTVGGVWSWGAPTPWRRRRSLPLGSFRRFSSWCS